ncbi:hypothetical protein F2P56_000521 [Juglans regia]|uniref:RRM domain-containing protein n=1 Tax=Juglans regia TaxID=51240 RepID=A0A834D364_JUGRE|nr:hypothetical protein F2P56_000521 [Juglans regia]
MAESCLISTPTLFTTKNQYPFLSLPSKPVKLSHLSFLSSPSPHSWVSLKHKSSTFRVVPLVAQTSDWAQQEEEEEGEEGSDGWEGEVGGGEESSGEGVLEESEKFYPEPPEEAKLFVGNLPFDIDSEKLAEVFNQAGIVEISEVIYNRETDRSRGFGFVTMSTVEEAEKAVDMLNRYVFSEHGKVIDARVLCDQETGRSRGFGFVTMSSETELNDAIAALDGQNLDGRAIRVNVAEERRRRGSFSF